MAAVFMSLFLLNLLAAGSSTADAQRPRNSTLNRLTRHLLLNYSKGVRPVRNWSKATTIYLDLSVHAVLDVDTQNQKLTTSIWFRQIWKDEFLTWNSSLYDGISEISLPLSTIWSPDIVINEFVDVSKSPDLPYVYVNAAGKIKNHKPMQVVSACSLEAYAFPFDTQNCSLTFSSILHTVEDVDLNFWRSREDIKNDKMLFLNDGVFFTVCMALLVLSLSKSILLVKFLHLGEDPVRKRLFSCCWVGSALDRGSPGERSQAPRLQAAGDIAGLLLHGEEEEGKGEGPWKVTSARKAPMEKILAELLLISSHLRALDWAGRLEVNWLTLSYRLDRLLFWVYVLILGVYAVTLCSLWVVWSSQ
nr:5-hydroxytryptamine receptor 3B isoform X3 [Caretta caretta]